MSLVSNHTPAPSKEGAPQLSAKQLYIRKLSESALIENPRIQPCLDFVDAFLGTQRTLEDRCVLNAIYVTDTSPRKRIFTTLLSVIEQLTLGQRQSADLKKILFQSSILSLYGNSFDDLSAFQQNIVGMFKDYSPEGLERSAHDIINTISMASERSREIVRANLSEAHFKSPDQFLLHLLEFEASTIQSEVSLLEAYEAYTECRNKINIDQLEGNTTFYFDGQALTFLPPDIGKLAQLTHLSLTQNHLQTLPSELGQLEQLQNLDLTNNKLQSLPAAIRQLHSLQYLYLSNNDLQILPPEIIQLRVLETLILTNNDLQTLPLVITELPSLKSLGLVKTGLQTLPPEIAHLTTLTDLDLRHNNLVTVPIVITKLAGLTELMLGDNHLESVPCELGQLLHLEVLDLSENNLTALPLELGQLAKLKELNLARNPEIASLPAEFINKPDLQLYNWDS